jgi:ATP-dependent helicase/DNAse subunit B
MQREFSVSMKQKNIRVMTFSTLTEEIFRTLGGACKRTPDSAAVTAAINLAVINTYSKLGYYKSVALGSGFALKLSEAFTQFDINRLSADSLKKIPDTEISPSIRRKYADLFTIYEEYKNICKSDYILQGDSLVKAAGIIELEPFFENTPVIFDGFHGFTPTQLTFIEQVLLSAPDCVFSMTTVNCPLVSVRCSPTSVPSDRAQIIAWVTKSLPCGTFLLYRTRAFSSTPWPPFSSLTCAFFSFMRVSSSWA